MMKKLKTKAGMSLMEVMVALLIMVLLVVGMGTGMDAGMRVYADAHFESSSASLAGTLNTALTDVLRYANVVREPNEGETFPAGVTHVFSNYEYGLSDVYLAIPSTGDRKGVLQVVNLSDNNGTPVVNPGLYPNLQIISFSITYYPEGEPGTLTTLDAETTVNVSRGGFFYIKYKIANKDGTKTRDAETVVRLMNG